MADSLKGDGAIAMLSTHNKSLPSGWHPPSKFLVENVPFFDGSLASVPSSAVKGVLDLLNYAIRDDATMAFPFSVTDLWCKMSVKFFTFMMDLFMILPGSPLALKTITNQHEYTNLPCTSK